MNKRINFEDNIFILNNRIRMIENTIILDADADLFLEKTMDDLDFVDSILAILLDSLQKNDKLIERSAQFYNLIEAEEKFSVALNGIIRNKGSISVSEYPAVNDKIQPILLRSKQRQDIIQDSINSLSGDPQDTNIVSSDELQELLRDF